MKKQITIIALMIATVNIGFAQQNSDETDYREELRFGLKAGFNYSNVYDEKGDDFVADPKMGFVGGAFLAIPLGKYLGFQPEILYSQKGFKADGVLLGSPYSFTRTSTYLDIPLQATLKPSEFITLLAGIQYSYLLKQKDEFTSSFSSYAQEQEFKNDNIHKNILGFVGGVDINLKQLTLGARLGWDVSENKGDGESTTPRYKNKWAQVTVGFCF